ncbi:uncharacterized protein LOC129220766 [Uloborus diversus]|uniref:uncharacterized protein LOC129220766 n=1 Tax=Uloborus diversus TaxID=327109 RepID=UPI0024099719|nr:uncharacterized protein LOC129220766 [Uloborus diversus]
MTSKKVVINEKPKPAKKSFFPLFRSESVTAKTSAEADKIDCNANNTETKKLMRRSSMICSEGFDKYTYDCHYFGIPPKPSTKQENDKTVKESLPKTQVESAVSLNHGAVGENLVYNNQPYAASSRYDNVPLNETTSRQSVRSTGPNEAAPKPQHITSEHFNKAQNLPLPPKSLPRQVSSVSDISETYSSSHMPPVQKVKEPVNIPHYHPYSNESVRNFEYFNSPSLSGVSFQRASIQNVPPSYNQSPNVPSSNMGSQQRLSGHFHSFQNVPNTLSMPAFKQPTTQLAPISETDDSSQKLNSQYNFVQNVQHLPPSGSKKSLPINNSIQSDFKNVFPSNVRQNQSSEYLPPNQINPVGLGYRSQNAAPISTPSLNLPNEPKNSPHNFQLHKQPTYDDFARNSAQNVMSPRKTASQKITSEPVSILKKNVSVKSALIKRDSVVHPEKVNMQSSLCINGRFQNPWPTWSPPTLTNILKFGISKDNSKVPPKQELDLILPMVKQNFSKLSIPDDGIRVTWIGHSTVLVQMHGLNILTDPIFSDRASPSQVVGPKRFRDPPCSIHDLPHINAVVISHNHYDHLDYNTVILLNARFGTDIRWFVPLGLQSWMQNVGCENVVELDWWEENCVPEHSDTFFVFTPAQHWSKRTLGDDNKSLWGSWCVLGPKYRFFFAGDTGYCEVFKQIGKVHGPFDLSAIPIGAYEPRWFMKYQHVNPEEAVQIHMEVRSKKSLAIHWGTFCLANEYYLDPPVKLRNGLDKYEIPPENFFTMKHGETRLIAHGSNTQKILQMPCIESEFYFY